MSNRLSTPRLVMDPEQSRGGKQLVWNVPYTLSQIALDLGKDGRAALGIKRDQKFKSLGSVNGKVFCGIPSVFVAYLSHSYEQRMNKIIAYAMKHPECFSRLEEDRLFDCPIGKESDDTRERENRIIRKVQDLGIDTNFNLDRDRVKAPLFLDLAHSRKLDGSLVLPSGDFAQFDLYQFEFLDTDLMGRLSFDILDISYKPETSTMVSKRIYLTSPDFPKESMRRFVRSVKNSRRNNPFERVVREFDLSTSLIKQITDRFRFLQGIRAVNSTPVKPRTLRTRAVALRGEMKAAVCVFDKHDRVVMPKDKIVSTISEGAQAEALGDALESFACGKVNSLIALHGEQEFPDTFERLDARSKGSNYEVVMDQWAPGKQGKEDRARSREKGDLVVLRNGAVIDKWYVDFVLSVSYDVFNFASENADDAKGISFAKYLRALKRTPVDYTHCRETTRERVLYDRLQKFFLHRATERMQDTGKYSSEEIERFEAYGRDDTISDQARRDHPASIIAIFHAANFLEDPTSPGHYDFHQMTKPYYMGLRKIAETQEAKPQK